MRWLSAVITEKLSYVIEFDDRVIADNFSYAPAVTAGQLRWRQHDDDDLDRIRAINDCQTVLNEFSLYPESPQDIVK